MAQPVRLGALVGAPLPTGSPSSAPPRELLELVVHGVAGAPPGQAKPEVAMEARAALRKGLGAFTDRELWDLLHRVADRDPCDISPFVRALCDLKQHYLPPVGSSK